MPDRYGVVGHPIAHSLSPTIHRLFAEATDQAVQYDRYDITPENFEREIRAFFDSGGQRASGGMGRRAHATCQKSRSRQHVDQVR
jgi:shikimate dehydrogenase